MQKEEAIAWFGSQQKLANFLGVAQSNVSSWKNIPRHHQDTIEKHTQGRLCAVDNTKKQRYMCTIEKRYLDILKDHAHMLGVPVVEILRRAIKMYADKHTLKKQ
jgi:hypothetical protein